MATLTWVGGGNNRASNPNDWSPAQVPVSGDVLMMPLGGSMNIAGLDLAGDTLEIGSGEAAPVSSPPAFLNLSHHAQVSIDQPAFSGTSTATTITVAGQDTLSVNVPVTGVGPFSSGPIVVNLAPGASLAGSFETNYSSITVNGARGARLINDGNTDFSGTVAVINADVVGTGSFQVASLPSFLGLAVPGSLEFADAVSRGETVTIGNPTIAQAGIEWDELKIDQPREFHGSVVLQPNAFVELVGLATADSYSYSKDILSIWSGDHVIDTLRLTNQSGGDLVVATDSSGDVFVEPSGPSPLQETLTPLPLHETSYTITTLNAPGATSTFASAINDRGEVAGYYFDSSGIHGYVDANGTFTTLNVPGAAVTFASAINDHGEVVGNYEDSTVGHVTGDGFIYDDGTYTTLSAPGASDTVPSAINDRGEITGNYFSAGEELGFIYDKGTFTTLDGPGGATVTSASAINDRGEVVGSYASSSTGEHGYIYDNGTFTTLTAPGAMSTGASAINEHGEVVGTYVNSSGDTLSFLYDDGTYTTLNVPNATSTNAVAINDRGEVAGNYVDGSGVSHGFVYDNGTYTTLNGPVATDSFVDGINDLGEVSGTYYDSSGAQHGFQATPEGGEASTVGFGEVLSAHARQSGVNDLLRGIPGIHGGSPHSANDAGMMDQTLPTGARFASFGGLASDQTATQALLHANGTPSGAG